MKRQFILGLVILLGLSFCVTSCYKAAYCIDDGIEPGRQRLWTTNSTGQVEINWFNVGDPIYLKTGTYVPPTVNPLVPGIYTVYTFEGDIILNASDNGKKIPDQIGNGIPVAPPINVTTDSNGHFGQDAQGGPILIWNSAGFGNFTIVLDRAAYYDFGSSHYVNDPGYGFWDSSKDYREDQCTATPTPPSFFVIPQVPLGTLLTVVGFFCGLGLFVKAKRKP